MTRHLRRNPLSVAPKVPATEPDLSSFHKQAILTALRWAWQELVRTAPHILIDGTEDEITDKLQTLLNDRRSGRRLAIWIKDFETVTRGESQRTADGRLNKKPDLVFRPPPYSAVVNATRWGWFIECKIIDGGTSLRAYRDEGVSRFWAGEYAAWMPSGALLGYVRDGSRPIPSLNTTLNATVGTRWHLPGPTPDQSHSHHDRSKTANPCIAITLTHVWLPAK